VIKLQNLKATNFLSFKRLELNFKKGLYLIDGFNLDENTSNGAGKSAVIDAICFALYGDLPRKVKFEEVINWNESSLDIQVSFFKNNKHHFIHRGRNPNLLNFYVDTVLKNGKDNRETQQIITKMLGLSLNTFLRSIYYSQNTDVVAQFLSSNDEEKKDVLTELLDLYIYDECYDSVKKDSQAFLEKKNELSRDISYNQKQIKDKQDESIRLQKMSDSFEEMRKEEIKKIKSQMKNFKEEKSAITDKYKKETELAKVVDSYQAKIDELNNSIDLVSEKRLGDIKLTNVSVEKEIQLLQKQLKQFDDLIAKGVCPTCLQEVSGEKLDGAVKPLSSKINKLTREKENVETQIKELSKVVLDNASKKKEMDELRIKVIASQNILKNAKSNYDAMIKNIDKHMVECDGQLDRKTKEENNYGNLIKEYEEKVLGLKVDIDNKNGKIQALDRYVEVYGHLIKAFSKEGVKAYVFARIINEINHYINDYLNQMFDANVSLKFDIESYDSQGKAKQKMDTILTIDGERKNINILSGGERARLILATNFALSKIIATRCPSMPNFILMDECFTGLDNNGKLKVMEFLKKLSENKDFIYVIDHNTEFKQAFDGSFKVEKKDGVSQLTEE
jgi:exonuclease SbcC